MVIHLKIDLLSWLLFPQAGADQRWNQGGGANHKSRPGVIWASGCVHLIVLGGGHLYQVLQEVDRFTRFSEQAVVRCTSQDLHTSRHVTQVLLCNMASEEVSLSWQRLMNRWEVLFILSVTLITLKPLDHEVDKRITLSDGVDDGKDQDRIRWAKFDFVGIRVDVSVKRKMEIFFKFSQSQMHLLKCVISSF